MLSPISDIIIIILRLTLDILKNVKRTQTIDSYS